MHFTIQIDKHFSINCYFKANLKIDVAKSRILRGISKVKLKSEVHSPSNFLLSTLIRSKLVDFEICQF